MSTLTNTTNTVTVNKNRVWTKDEILHLLETNDEMVIRSLLKIYELQTQDEQKLKHTKHVNNVGFNSPDAPALSDMAQWYQKKGYLTDKQIWYIRKRITKYANQLTLVANHQL